MGWRQDRLQFIILLLLIIITIMGKTTRLVSYYYALQIWWRWLPSNGDSPCTNTCPPAGPRGDLGKTEISVIRREPTILESGEDDCPAWIQWGLSMHKHMSSCQKPRGELAGKDWDLSYQRNPLSDSPHSCLSAYSEKTLKIVCFNHFKAFYEGFIQPPIWKDRIEIVPREIGPQFDNG